MFFRTTLVISGPGKNDANEQRSTRQDVPCFRNGMLGQVAPRGPFQSNFFCESVCAGITSGSEVKANMRIRKENKGSEALLQIQLSKWCRYHANADAFHAEIRNDPL